MKNKFNRKGFTLIELLAVIVVLAILLVIAVPRVLDVISTTRKETLGKSTQVVAKYLKQMYTIEMMKPSFVATPSSDFSVDCPEAAGFNEPEEGDCQYHVTFSGLNPIVSVKIVGNGRFSGWVATSVDGQVATIDGSDEPVEEGPFVQDVVAIGDYIEYDAGNWSSTVALPTVQGTFGGYTSGNSKNQGLACESAAAIVSGRYGWRVFNINSTTGEVSIIHVGTPECYYSDNNAAASVTTLTTHDYSYYVNSTYANSATILTKAMSETLYGSAIVYEGGFWDVEIPDELLLSGSRYYFPDVYNVSYLYYVQPSGYVGATRYYAYGIRPVVNLKTNIYISSGDGTSGNKYVLSTTN